MPGAIEGLAVPEHELLGHRIGADEFSIPESKAAAGLLGIGPGLVEDFQERAAREGGALAGGGIETEHRAVFLPQQAEAAFIVDCRARGMRLAAPLQGPVECVQIGGERLRVDTGFKAAADEDQPAGLGKDDHLRIHAEPAAALRLGLRTVHGVAVAGGGDILEGEVRLGHLEFIVARRERLPRPGAARQPELVSPLGQRLVLEEVGHEVAGRRVEPGARHARGACDLKRAVGRPR